MQLTERFTRVADDVLLYEFTVNDPDAFTQPWTVQIPSQRVAGRADVRVRVPRGQQVDGRNSWRRARSGTQGRGGRETSACELREVEGTKDEESVVCSAVRGRGAARGRAGPSLVRVGVRCESTGLLERHRDEGGVHQPALVDPHRSDGDDGTKAAWEVEGGTPNTLFRKGINDSTLPVGTAIAVDGYRARDGSNRMSGRDITLADGRKVFLSGSAPP